MSETTNEQHLIKAEVDGSNCQRSKPEAKHRDGYLTDAWRRLRVWVCVWDCLCVVGEKERDGD